MRRVKLHLIGPLRSSLIALVIIPWSWVLHAAEPKFGPWRIGWEDNMLTIRGEGLPGQELKVWYIEAYCRPGSTDRDWRETTIGHTTELINASDHALELRCRLTDGVTVTHKIRSVPEGVDFRLVANNPTPEPSLAHWAQPCIRVDRFTGRTQKTYLEKCFIFLDGKLARMPTPNWANAARYVPGQVWCPLDVSRQDVNPRPLSSAIPTNGLIGCFSADERYLLATAWEPYQELFQGVIVCLHSDFRIGGLEPGETKHIRGKIYVMENDIDLLMEQYQRDFPEHATLAPGRAS
jgi:hypothetical protein